LPNLQRLSRFKATAADREPTLCVWNCPRRDEVGPPRARANDVGVRLLYHGTIVPSRLPLRFLEALPDLPVNMLVIGYETQGHPGYTFELRRYAERLGIADRLHILPGLPRYQLLGMSRQADIGLSLVPAVSDDMNMRWMTGASNKPFDYMAGGLALLVSDMPDWRQMYVAPGYGLACNPENPASVRDALRWLIEHPTQMRAMGELGRQRIAADWNYETQFGPVLDRIDPRIETNQYVASTIR
jgi:glycosyltransferase involved in cell wall biosynthesis